MNKKQLWERKLTQRNKKLKEAYDDNVTAKTADEKQVSASASTRSTRTYNYEDVEFEFGARKGFGTYRWMNRPWQRFDFASALQKAMIDAGVDEEFARECIEKSGSLRGAVAYFANNYKTEKQLKESDMMNESDEEEIEEVGSFEFCVMDKYGNNIDCFQVEEDAIMFAKKNSNAHKVLLVKYGPEDEYGDTQELSAETIWIVNDNEDDDKQNDDHKTIRENDCDRLALTQYEGGEPVYFTTSDKELEDWLNADPEHSWFPVDLNPEDDDDKEESLKENVEENKVYQIKYWLTEEDREEGFSDIFIDSFDSKQEAIMTAKKMVDRGDVASVEVFDADDVTEQPVYFYDGVETWGNEKKDLELKEEKNNNKGAKIASIIASALNKQGGHGPMGNEEVVADGNTITLVSQAGLETYKFNDDGSVDNLSIDDMIKTMLEDGEIEESEIEDIREEYGHFNSIKDLLQSNLTWFMNLPEKLIIKKVEEILGEEKDLEEAFTEKDLEEAFDIDVIKKKAKQYVEEKGFGYDFAVDDREVARATNFMTLLYATEEALEIDVWFNQYNISDGFATLASPRSFNSKHNEKQLSLWKENKVKLQKLAKQLNGNIELITLSNGDKQVVLDVGYSKGEEKDLEEARGAGKGQKLDKYYRMVVNLYKDNLSKEEIERLKKAKSEVEKFEPKSEHEKRDKKNLLDQIARTLEDGTLKEALVAYDPARWEPEDIELHKSIDWKERNWEDFPVEGDTIETEVILYSLHKSPRARMVTAQKYLRANPIYSPYYEAKEVPFKDEDEGGVVGGMFDGNKHNKTMIMDRYETANLNYYLSI